MDKQALREKLIEVSGPRKRISCQDARELAEETGSPYADVGKLCNELGIKIFSCELGCF